MKGRKASTTVMVLLLASIANIGFSAIPVSASNGNIVVNGSFEDPEVPYPKKWDIFASIPGWTAEWAGGSTSWNGYTRPSVAYFELQRERDPTNGRETPYGAQWIELDSDWFGPDGVSGEPANIAIHQNLATVPGGVYQLSFAYSPRPIAADNRLVVEWDGMTVADIGASGSMVWTTYTDIVTASSSTTELRFEEAGTADSLGMFLDRVCVTLVEIVLDIDIKPCSFPNSINLGSKGVLPVAVLGKAGFDVKTIDPSTIGIGGVPVAERGPWWAWKLAVSYGDVNKDGWVDLVAFFRIPELVSGGALTSATTSLTLTANLYDGTPISGSDSVRIVPPFRP